MARSARGQAGVPDWVEPMLAKPDRGRLPSGPDWAYEYKLDGYRAAMRVGPDGTTILTSRNGIDFTEEFPTLTGVLDLAGRTAVFDGEIVVYNEAGNVDFGLLQDRRGRFRKHQTAGRVDQFEGIPVRYLVFDLLRLGDQSLLGQPYEQRRAQLTQIPMPDPYRISIVPSITFAALAADRLTPQQLLSRVATEGQEGLIAKHRSAPYTPGRRTDAWLKHALTHFQEVIICGWRPGQRGFDNTLGGLLLGAHDPGSGDLVYLGDVGTGFTQHARVELKAQLQQLERGTHPFATAPPREDVVRARWVEPMLVGEVEYRQFTRGDGRLRHTSWRGLRHDKSPAEVIAPHAQPRDEPEPPQPQRVTVRVGDRQLRLSNLDKPLYPSGFTKAHVISYYTQIAPVLLPHIADRPVTFIRFPDGVDGERFFEKNVANGAPEWLRTASLPSSGSRGSGEIINYPLIDDLPALVWAANLAALELHTPQWTVSQGAKGLPDRLVFDLDPGEGTTIVDCAQVALRLRELLITDGLTPLATTSGSKGMQLYAGIRTTNAKAPAAYAKTLAEHLAMQTPERVTAKMTKAVRTNRVFIDWSQNNPSKTTISPYSLRGRAQPTVATPITWDEVRECQTPQDLTFVTDTVLERVGLHGDLLADLAANRADLR
ncbi:DNA ligase D [Kibdelosporangium philippinense]|uniref:DNA ligase (ATP) n=1 Tax=Kibdelosporangium philippinense TaxID=211113 RepID=A0ABS8ZB06_9PSEU|nr:DNA ligase D [Kibdelosporangium philippinense]MCE7003012.1 DNA ligase D [Kibdelosporangium philippinense]